MGKHTKGPWSEKTKVCISSVPFDLRFLCSADHDKEAEANARLISAAPDLLEALKKYQAFNRLKNDRDVELFDLGERAIAKAKGGEG